MRSSTSYCNPQSRTLGGGKGQDQNLNIFLGQVVENKSKLAQDQNRSRSLCLRLNNHDDAPASFADRDNT